MNTEHDYVIVGGGSAGCVLAARLSEDPDTSVLLLEAGPPDDKADLHIPLRWLGLNASETDWAFLSAPEPGCDGRRLTLARGRTLGGSSSVNAMIYMRGAAVDFDAWGIDGWRWDDLLPYFLRAEDNERGPSSVHETGGPLGVSDGRWRDPMMEAFVDAAVESGLPRNDDFNDGSQLGAGRFQLTQRDGARCSTADAYLRPARSRPNLTVITDAQATRVVIEGGRAVRVEYERFGTRGVVRARAEVILSAGAYGSPQLLMLSGIGPADHLRARGVDVVADLPAVGAELSDHPAVALTWGSAEPGTLLDGFMPAAAEEYAATASGPLSSNATEAGAFFSVGGDQTLPDIQIHALGLPLLDEGTTDPSGHGVSLAPCLLQPRARGSVRLASGNPFTKPTIRCGYWLDDSDVADMAEGVRRAVEIASQPSLRRFASEPLLVPEALDDATVHAFIARNTFAFFHASGTAGIGRVVDAQLRVEGVDGLRVVDASVLPVVPRGNPNAVVIAVAERAADLVRGRVAA